jgi:hypothetical protein
MIQIMMKYSVSNHKIMLTFSQRDKHVETSYYWPEVGLSQRVRKVRFAAQISDKQSGKSYYKPSAVSHKLTVAFYAWCAAV